jgi:hopanoid biosynthesis associated radical SAM protein HpnH
MEKSLSKFEPNPYLSFVLHLDGLAQTHDKIAGRSGVFDTAIAGIGAAKRAGFQVRTNTTIYKGTDLEEIEGLFALLSQVGVDGIMVSPAFSFAAVDNDVFLSRSEANGIFQSMHSLRKRFRFYNTPIYWEFLEGKRELNCIPWSNPTVNPKGWKRPCYLITDGHCRSFRELMEETPWERYGVGNDPRCANCMVHYGFEADAVNQVGKSLSSIWETMRWNFMGG